MSCLVSMLYNVLRYIAIIPHNEPLPYLMSFNFIKRSVANLSSAYIITSLKCVNEAVTFSKSICLSKIYFNTLWAQS